MLYSLFYRYNSSCTVFWVSSFHLSVMLLSMLCRRGWGGGGGGRAWGRDLNVVVGPGIGHLTDLVLPGEGIFESFFARCRDNISTSGEILFECRLGRKRLRPNIMFPTSKLHQERMISLGCTHAPYGPERSGNHGGQREQAKAGWISLCFLQISFVLACF